MNENKKQERFIGLWGATGIGVGAIVGGGILALAGVAFSTTGVGAIIAFALNGLIAFITAISFAEMSTAFPESGGTYTFAKKVLSVKTAFAVGWIVWFASIVAAVLYALGFASYAAVAINHLIKAVWGDIPLWVNESQLTTSLAVLAALLYMFSLVYKSGAGKQWATIGKLIVFAILITGGFWALANRPFPTILQAVTPILPHGASGLFLAMGYTFIALQGFEFIAVMGGEISSPEKTIPKAMMLSLAIGLLVYLPLLFIVAAVGFQPGESIVAASAKHPETIIAVAVQNYMGPAGFWLVVVAAVLSMLSALKANLLAASWVAFTMGRDRTLPRQFGRMDSSRKTPVAAILATTSMVIIILFVVPDLAAAGAAASLIFLFSFALVHVISILARKRAGKLQPPFKAPWFPLLPGLGLVICVILAVSQGIAVPSAGLITVAWLVIGVGLFLFLFARHALIADASAEAWDPHLVRVRGRNPLILVPIANPENAEAMVMVANALTPADVGKILLFSVVSIDKDWSSDVSLPKPLADAQRVLKQALLTSYACGIYPEALVTMAEKPWSEISRVASTHRCESLLLGLTDLKEKVMGAQLEKLMSVVDCDVIILRAPKDWHMKDVRKILVPVRGRSEHNILRARLLTSLCRTGQHEVTFLRIVPKHTSIKNCKKMSKELLNLAEDEVRGVYPKVEIVRSDVAEDELIKYANANDLIILGLQRSGIRRKYFGEITLKIARNTQGAVIMISRKG